MMAVVAWLHTVAGRSAPRLLRLGGEIDLSTAPAIREQLFALPAHDVVIDMSGVRFFGTAAITPPLELRTRLRLDGHTRWLAAVPRVVRRPLTLLALPRAEPLCRRGRDRAGRPALVTVVAVLLGGTLLGIIGALAAIPVAAALLPLAEEVLYPRLDRS